MLNFTFVKIQGGVVDDANANKIKDEVLTPVKLAKGVLIAVTVVGFLLIAASGVLAYSKR